MLFNLLLAGIGLDFQPDNAACLKQADNIRCPRATHPDGLEFVAALEYHAPGIKAVYPSDFPAVLEHLQIAQD